jgi:Fur family ferric uptake transcriptional regulator
MERSTRQRAAIRNALDVAGRPLSAPEILASAQGEAPSLSLATVYRNLKQLVDDGALLPVMLPGENPRYELAHQDHHHHFQCRQCQRVFDVHACPGDFGHLAPAGFSVDGHELTLYGRCSDCAPRAARRKPVASKRA